MDLDQVRRRAQQIYLALDSGESFKVRRHTRDLHVCMLLLACFWVVEMLQPPMCLAPSWHQDREYQSTEQQRKGKNHWLGVGVTKLGFSIVLWSVR